MTDTVDAKEVECRARRATADDVIRSILRTTARSTHRDRDRLRSRMRRTECTSTGRTSVDCAACSPASAAISTSPPPRTCGCSSPSGASQLGVVRDIEVRAEVALAAMDDLGIDDDDLRARLWSTTSYEEYARAHARLRELHDGPRSRRPHGGARGVRR